MRMTEFFLAQLEREAPISKRILERVPEGRPDWKPHDRSMPLGYLAVTVATMPSWFAMMIERDELDIDPPDGPKWAPPAWKTAADLARIHDESVAAARAALEATDEGHLEKPWRLLVRARVVSETARHAVIAETFNHLAHHRGQLSVYLRLNDAAVPSLYGPSADDPSFA